MLVALNAIAMHQATPNQQTMERVKQLLNYCTSQEEAILMYHASDMVLAVHSNACSQAGGHFSLSSDVQNLPTITHNCADH